MAVAQRETDGTARPRLAGAADGHTPEMTLTDQVAPARRDPRTPRGILDWLFRSRRTGRITIAQAPNWTLAVWLVTTAALRLGNPQGGLRDALTLVATLALLAWSADELLRGVNPFRRILGGVVLAGLVLSRALG